MMAGILKGLLTVPSNPLASICFVSACFSESHILMLGQHHVRLLFAPHERLQ